MTACEWCPFAADKCGAACRWHGGDPEQLPLEEP